MAFTDVLKGEIARLEDVLSRNPTWQELQRLRAELAIREHKKQPGGRAAKQAKCGICKKYYSAHRDGNGADASGTITKIKLCPGSTTQTYEPAFKDQKEAGHGADALLELRNSQ
jgi:hypothetical protein